MRLTDSSAQIVRSGMEHGKVEVQLRMGNARGDARSSGSELKSSALKRLHVAQVSAIRIDGIKTMETVKKRADNVMRRHSGQVQHRRANEALIHATAVAGFRKVAVNRLKPLQKFLFALSTKQLLS